MRTIKLAAPQVEQRSAHFEWTVTPSSSLYRSERFSLVFPDGIDLDAVPSALWWRLGLLCLHVHWTLLRPCRVVLPVTLGAAEREFWQRLIDAAVAALERRSANPSLVRDVELVDGGPPVAPLQARTAGDGPIVACFSGGRDSLAQAGLLAELGHKPILASVRAPVEWSREQTSERRAEVLAAIGARGPFELVVVESDLRAAVENDFPNPYGVAVNELGDCLLYLAAAIAVAAARGASLVLMASEAEVQQSVRYRGRVAQHKHFMYSAVTHAALAALLEPTGIGVGSTTYPLRQFQVQRILTARYPALRDLQNSCWSMREGEPACSACVECFHNAMHIIDAGGSPKSAGIDLATLLMSPSAYERAFAADGGEDPDQPTGAAARASDLRCLGTLAATAPERIAELLEECEGDDASRRALAAAAFERLAARAREFEQPAEPGYREAYLELIDPRLRDGLRAIFREHFEPEPLAEYAQLLSNSLTLGRWIGGPLRAARWPATAPHPALPAAPPVARPLAPTTLSAAEIDAIATLLPAPEPALARGSRGILRVADAALDGNERAYLAECVDTGWVSSAGPFVGRFEREFAAATGRRFAVACSSGTAALHLALAAAGIGSGDEVVMPTFTMIATANAARYAGATPVLVDADPEDWNLDAAAIARKLTPRTRAIVVMHTYGTPVRIEEIAPIADRNGLVVVEDAAEAHGASHDGRPVGSLGAVAAFSLYGNKIITSGEGGALVTDDPEIAEAARSLRDHAFSPERHFWHRRLAFNYRMSNLQAAVAVAQLERLDLLVARRRAIAARYGATLAGTPGLELTPAARIPGAVPWMYGLTVGERFGTTRDELREHLAERGIETRCFFVPIHLQPIYRRTFGGQRYPVAERLGQTGLYLPSGPSLSDDDVDYIAAAVLGAARPRSSRGRPRKGQHPARAQR